jgi:hypothetical protein
MWSAFSRTRHTLSLCVSAALAGAALSEALPSSAMPALALPNAADSETLLLVPGAVSASAQSIHQPLGETRLCSPFPVLRFYKAGNLMHHVEIVFGGGDCSIVQYFPPCIRVGNLSSQFLSRIIGKLVPHAGNAFPDGPSTVQAPPIDGISYHVTKLELPMAVWLSSPSLAY